MGEGEGENTGVVPWSTNPQNAPGAGLLSKLCPRICMQPWGPNYSSSAWGALSHLLVFWSAHLLTFDIFTYYRVFLSFSPAFLCNSHISLLFQIRSCWFPKKIQVKHIHSIRSRLDLNFCSPRQCAEYTMWPLFGRVWRPLESRSG